MTFFFFLMGNKDINKVASLNWLILPPKPKQPFQNQSPTLPIVTFIPNSVSTSQIKENLVAPHTSLSHTTILRNPPKPVQRTLLPNAQPSTSYSQTNNLAQWDESFTKFRGQMTKSIQDSLVVQIKLVQGDMLTINHIHVILV